MVAWRLLSVPGGKEGAASVLPGCLTADRGKVADGPANFRRDEETVTRGDESAGQPTCCRMHGDASDCRDRGAQAKGARETREQGECSRPSDWGTSGRGGPRLSRCSTSDPGLGQGAPRFQLAGLGRASPRADLGPGDGPGRNSGTDPKRAHDGTGRDVGEGPAGEGVQAEREQRRMLEQDKVTLHHERNQALPQDSWRSTDFALCTELT